MRNKFTFHNLNTLLDLYGGTSDKVVVISIVGKTAFNTNGLKVKSIGRVFHSGPHTKDECKIEGTYDEENQIIYLHLQSLLDAHNFVEFYGTIKNEYEAENGCDDFLAVYDEVKKNFARALYILVHISHIIVLSHPGSTFDTNYIQYFKAMDSLNQNLYDKIYDELSGKCDISKEWSNKCRLCSPRLIFYFERCPKNVSKIKKLEHNLEDKIYHILKKTRIINSTGSALFAIPLNEEFVYVSTSGAHDPLGDAVRGLIHDCQPGGAMQVEPPYSNQPSSDRSFAKFLEVHIQQARNKGFDDTGRQFTQPAHFELPLIHNWIEVSKIIYETVMKVNSVPSLCTDTRFSEQRCLKVLPLALARYQEGLPTHYAKSEHEARLNMALALFKAQARGPAYNRYTLQLECECDRHWQNGRQQCEVASMTGNPCSLKKHSAEQEHSSGFIYKAICDCGRKIGAREDPYNAKQANYIFYHLIAKECQCSKLERFPFPIFEPSIKEYKAATLHDIEPKEPRSSPLSEIQSEELEPLETERTLVRQASTTEYLPGMLTMTSPPGLLPVYSSWSLVCLGASSLYSHNLGLSESHHPGFLSSTNYLLPWDVTVGSKSKANWHSGKYAGRGRRGRTTSTGTPQLTVKVFIGAEYECSVGHRFMLAAPDRILKATPGSIVKDTGHKIAESELPLYFLCACRAAKLAQLMRLHVVTPKAPVHCTLNPKVQPAPGSPIFIPSVDGAVNLTQSAYWILRLPYVYVADQEHFPLNLSSKLLQGVFGVTEVDQSN